MRTKAVRNHLYLIQRDERKKMSMFLNHDLVKAILDDRRAEARRASLRHQARSAARARVVDDQPDQAEVIELVFGRHCETDQIGA